MIKVVIVDDHDLFAEGLKSMFKPEDGIEVVGATKNGHHVPKILDETEVDLLLMDIDMPIIDGIATLSLLKKKGYNVPSLMLTMHQSMKPLKGALENGAQGYILKDASKKELVEAIIKTSNRENYFHPRINDKLFDYFRNKNKAATGIEDLSEREKEIIQCLANGMNSKAIANALFISEHTVRTHRRNIMHKLQVKTSAELIKLSIEREII